MSDPDPRPRPEYGEYATPEEQRARMGLPAAEAGAPAEGVTAISAPTAPGRAYGAVTTEVPVAPRRRPVDRIVTFALLAYGLVNVVAAFPAMVDFAAYADSVFQLMGVDAELTDPAAGRPWGIAAALVLAVGWFVTAAVSWWSIRRGRLSWWIPLAGGFVFMSASAVLMLIPLMSDPAVWEAIVGSVR